MDTILDGSSVKVIKKDGKELVVVARSLFPLSFSVNFRVRGFSLRVHHLIVRLLSVKDKACFKG